jgi:hypothetical protein
MKAEAREAAANTKTSTKTKLYRSTATEAGARAGKRAAKTAMAARKTTEGERALLWMNRLRWNSFRAAAKRSGVRLRLMMT